jgi:hypothetical protein
MPPTPFDAHYKLPFSKSSWILLSLSVMAARLSQPSSQAYCLYDNQGKSYPSLFTVGSLFSRKFLLFRRSFLACTAVPSPRDANPFFTVLEMIF